MVEGGGWKGREEEWGEEVEERQKNERWRGRRRRESRGDKLRVKFRE